MGWLRRLFGGRQKVKEGSGEHGKETDAQEAPDDWTRAKHYMQKVESKIDKLAEDFANGTINRAQFKELYTHYQRELRSVGQVLEHDPQTWQQSITEGKSVMIRRRHSARAEAYAIYENTSGIPLKTLGKFTIDPDLLVPMLSSYRSVAQEIFGAGIRTTQTEGGRWLCFVPGEATTMLAVFTNEPAGRQLEHLGNLHKLFELANRPALSNTPINSGSLIFPHEYFLGKWQQ